MRTIAAIFTLFILSTTVSAWDLNLVDSKPVPDAALPLHIDVVLTQDGGIAGYCYLHYPSHEWQTEGRFVVDLHEYPRTDILVPARLKSSVSVAQPDGQYVFYILGEINMPKAHIYKAALKPSLSLIDSVAVINERFYRGGAPMDEYRYELSLVDSILIFEEDRREQIWDQTIGFEEHRRVQSTALNLDLTQIIQWPGRSMRPFFNETTQTYWWGYVYVSSDYINNDWGTDGWGSGSEGVIDSEKKVVVAEGSDGAIALVESGDMLPDAPGEEIVYNSPTAGILLLNPGGWNLSCYYADGASLRQAWYTASPRFDKIYHNSGRNLIVGLTPLNEFYIYDASTGTLLETIPVNPDIIFYDFHETAPTTGRLLIVGREANELLLYEFAEVTGIDDTESDILLPDEIEISAAWPNPFNADVNIRLNVPTRRHVTVEIVNVLGQVVTEIYHGDLTAGEHRLHWDGRNADGSVAASGVYFARARDNATTTTIKIQLLK